MSQHLRDEARRTLQLLDELDAQLREPEILTRLPAELISKVIVQGVMLSSSIATDERLERLQVVNKTQLDQLRHEHRLLHDVLEEVSDTHSIVGCVKRRTSFCALCIAIDKWNMYQEARNG